MRLSLPISLAVLALSSLASAVPIDVHPKVARSCIPGLAVFVYIGAPKVNPHKDIWRIKTSVPPYTRDTETTDYEGETPDGGRIAITQGRSTTNLRAGFYTIKQTGAECGGSFGQKCWPVIE